MNDLSKYSVDGLIELYKQSRKWCPRSEAEKNTEVNYIASSGLFHINHKDCGFIMFLKREQIEGLIRTRAYNANRN